MNKISKIICFPFDCFCVGLVWVYKIFISPLKQKSCVFYPTCSTYMILAIKEYHFVKGVWFGLKRLVKCNPKSHGGFDPVPVNIKGEIRWVL